MLTAHHLSKSYNINPVLQDVSFSLHPAERAGLIGPNGCGKTTLLRILAGLEAPDRGSVATTRPDLRIGYLQQGFEPGAADSVAALIEKSLGSPQQAEAEVARLAADLAAQPGRPELHAAYDAALRRLQALDPTGSGRARTILSALGLAAIQDDRPVSTLSGGQKTRLGLALVLLGDPHLLLLDEPINHLDIPSRARFEQALANFEGTVLAVVHDRYFIERFADELWLVREGGVGRS